MEVRKASKPGGVCRGRSVVTSGEKANGAGIKGQNWVALGGSCRRFCAISFSPPAHSHWAERGVASTGDADEGGVGRTEARKSERAGGGGGDGDGWPSCEGTGCQCCRCHSRSEGIWRVRLAGDPGAGTVMASEA